jgi:hypothetical protein
MSKDDKSFFFRHCLVSKKKHSKLVDYLEKELNSHGFKVQRHELNNEISLLLSYTNTENFLREAQYSKLRKVFTSRNSTTSELQLPEKVVENEKKRNFTYKDANDYVPDSVYDQLYNNKKTDENWGLGLFTESEMLYLENKILMEIKLNSTEEFIKLLPGTPLEKKIEDVKHILETEKSLYHVLSHFKVIKENFALHVSDFKESILKETITSLRCPYRKIRSYYGDKVAIYYAWVYHYTRFLIGPAAFVVFMFILKKFTSIQEKYLLTLYALLIAVWAQLFIVYWSRKCSEISIEWDNFTEEYDKENFRREFKGEWRISPITEQYELYYSESKRKIQYLISFLVSLPCLMFALFVNICFLNLSGFIRPHMGSFFEIPFLLQFSEEGQLFAPGSFLNTLIGIIQVICIQIINKFYKRIAQKTTDRENHKNRSNYENTLIIKRFVFEFFDGFVGLFYLAFVVKDEKSLREMLVR